MAQTALPASDISAGSWTPSVGSTLYGTIDEAAADDADFIQSSLSPAMADVSEVKLGALTDPLSSSGHVVNYRYTKDSASGDRINLNVRLVQGTTIIASWYHTDIDGSTITTASQALTGAQADAITNYADLRLRFEVYEAPDAPIAPATANYTLPTVNGTTIVSVTTQAQFETQLGVSGVTDIILENGSYTRTGPLTIGTKHIWARSVGGVTLNYGIYIGGNSGVAGAGGELHGLTITCATNAQAAGAGIIHIWNPTYGINAKITDCTITGNTAFSNETNGIVCYVPQGLVIQRCVINTATGNGLRLSDNSIASTAVINTITDLDISNVSYATPGSANGTSEAGLWIGHQVTNTVTRIKVRNTGWMGMWTGNRCHFTNFSHLDIDQCGPNGGVGFYLEHTSHVITIDTFKIGPTVSVGFNHEWDYNQEYLLSGSHTFPTSVVTVSEGVGNAATSGTLQIGNPDGTITSVSYTGATGNTFTGCTGGTGTFPSGTIVAANGSLATSAAPGGFATYKVTMKNGVIEAGAGSGYGIFLDNGTMFPTVQNVAFVRCLSGIAIRDRTNSPQATNTGNSNLTITTCYFAPGITQRTFG